jgi:hypothetical protein
LSIEPALQDEGGGKLVDETAADLAADVAVAWVLACGFERGVDLSSGEALVPEVNGEVGMAFIGGVFLCLGRRLGDEPL